ncbi:XkdF-like putative serine protease domain-containing protein [Sulfurimonas sp.]|uniref:XkdF-like putative serine protease domain-containing protein n=1 Tax=Sulfurimonas sp. TaxID=2022749 RepID=UPI00262F12C9|nr:XkdF-like putative serine protease domain-containing protein [Sulfurimonas sp.]MDD3452567.1 XkdF-like putative serine protease domain-containing protein [Sulfurimonas sp.]
MPNRLTDINVTHISLVKAGANGKVFIYKSAADHGGYEHTIEIRKTDEEQGIVYGIVYSPGQVDTQGDFAEAGDIKKAAYGFMKSLNAKNVDVDHSFQNEDAYVAESWLTKSGDPIFPDEPEGSWAVAIQLESDELKEMAKSGDLAGLSMAGTAQKTEVKKADGDTPIKRLFSAFADAVGEVWFDFGGRIAKSKEEGFDMKKEVESLGDSIKKKINASVAGVVGEIEKSNKEQAEKIEALEKSAKEAGEKMEELKKANEDLGKVNEDLKKENEKLSSDLKTQGEKITALEKKAGEVEETLKKSNQRKDIKKDEAKKDNEGVM